jgi:hypothetical protein
VQTDIVSVELDVSELEIPFDMIIGRPSICEHRLLRFDAELSKAGFETQISRQAQPVLTSKEPPVAPAISEEVGPKGLTLQNPEIGSTDRGESKDRALELLWIVSEREHGRTESTYSVPAEAVMSSRPTEDTGMKVPTARLLTMREPKIDL